MSRVNEGHLLEELDGRGVVAAVILGEALAVERLQLALAGHLELPLGFAGPFDLLPQLFASQLNGQLLGFQPELLALALCLEAAALLASLSDLVLAFRVSSSALRFPFSRCALTRGFSICCFLLPPRVALGGLAAALLLLRCGFAPLLFKTRARLFQQLFGPLGKPCLAGARLGLSGRGLII